MKNESTLTTKPVLAPPPIDEKNTVSVSRKGIVGGPATATIKKRGQRILAALGCTECELSIVIGTDSFIQQLNRDYRNKNSATDVLSFPMNDISLDAPTGLLLGDIVISLDTATRQANMLGGSLLDEVTSLLVHGILHLLGYTHENEPNENQMNARTIELLKLF